MYVKTQTARHQEVNIRNYAPADFEQIKKLFYDTVHAINNDYTQEQLDAWAPKDAPMERMRASLQNSFAYVAQSDGVITGFANIDENGYIDYLYVHKNYQDKGIGSALLKKLIEKAEALQLPQIETHASITAKPLFEKFGFSVIKEQRVKRGDIELTNYVMIKKL